MSSNIPVGNALGCGPGSKSQAEYNKPLHVGALFVVFSVSTFACIFPLLATHFPRLHVPQKVLFVFKHFGTGVLIATAFCHLLPTAFISLLDPCLTQSGALANYPAMGGAIAMSGVFLVVSIELAFAELHGGNKRHYHHRSELVDGRVRHTDGTVTPTKEPSITSDLTREEEKKAFMQCLLLEIGILFHSVFIGMALSVARGQGFLVLFIAILFHQTFEGLSLGTRIALLKFPDSTFIFGHKLPRAAKPFLMACTYGLTTPLGQAIGLALLFSSGSSYDPASKTALILVGVMNALSSGLLLWASLVELLAADFFGEERMSGIMGTSWKWRVFAFVCVVFGAACMATVGAWA